MVYTDNFSCFSFPTPPPFHLPEGIVYLAVAIVSPYFPVAIINLKFHGFFNPCWYGNTTLWSGHLGRHILLYISVAINVRKCFMHKNGILKKSLLLL